MLISFIIKVHSFITICKIDDLTNLQAEDRTPFVVVALQECEHMNMLCMEVKRSLGELDLGLKVSAGIKMQRGKKKKTMM